MSDKTEIIDSLIEMGFDRRKAELVCVKANPRNLDEAIDWMFSHEDELESIPEPTDENVMSSSEPESTVEPDNNESNVPETSTATLPEAKSIKCEDCGKLFKSQAEVEFHATKSGHENFAESTEEKKPLSEEEKKMQLASIEAKLKQRRLEREAREKQEEIEREKNRIKSGKEILEAKKKHEELEIKKLVEQRRKDKEEERLARQRVKDQIEQDKLMRKAKFGGGQMEQMPPPPTVQPKKEEESVKPTTEYSNAKLQIRLTNGETLTQTFSAKEPLSAVRLYVEMNRTDTPGAFGLMTSFPRRVFTSEDYQKPLSSLDLAPSAVLIVSKSAGPV